MQNYIPTLDFADLTDAQLADEIGKLDIMVKAYQQSLELAKSEFKMRGNVSVAGEGFTVTVRVDTRQTFDGKAVKKEMGEDWYASRCKATTYPVIQIRANAGLVAMTEAA